MKKLFITISFFICIFTSTIFANQITYTLNNSSGIALGTFYSFRECVNLANTINPSDCYSVKLSTGDVWFINANTDPIIPDTARLIPVNDYLQRSQGDKVNVINGLNSNGNIDYNYKWENTGIKYPYKIYKNDGGQIWVSDKSNTNNSQVIYMPGLNK